MIINLSPLSLLPVNAVHCSSITECCCEKRVNVTFSVNKNKTFTHILYAIPILGHISTRRWLCCWNYDPTADWNFVDLCISSEYPALRALPCRPGRYGFARVPLVTFIPLNKRCADSTIRFLTHIHRKYKIANVILVWTLYDSELLYELTADPYFTTFNSCK